MATVIFDLDGTLADITHRVHLVQNGNRDWDGFYAACVDDTPKKPIIELATMTDQERAREAAAQFKQACRNNPRIDLRAFMEGAERLPGLTAK